MRGGVYSGASGNYRGYIGQSPLLRGKPFQVKVWRHWSTGPSGRTRVWLDGILVADDTGPNLEVGQEGSPYLKQGVYGGGWTGDAIVYYDDVRVAASESGL